MNGNGRPYDRFKAYLKQVGVTQTEAAKVIEVSDVVFSKKINNKWSTFSIEEIRKICEHFNIDPNTYFIGADISKPETEQEV